MSKAGKKISKPNQKKGVTKQPLPWLHILFLIAFTFIIYGNSINHDYALDDDIVTRLNSYVQKGFGGIPDIFSHGMLKGFNNINDRLSPYRPLSLMSLAIEKQFFGNNPVAHHFFNVLFFAVCVVILFLLLRRLFPQAHILFPFVMTLLFAAHPIHTEVVANIKSRDELLGFLFVILSLWFLMKQIAEGQDAKFPLAALVCFFLSLLSKESTLTFVAVIPLLLYFFTKISRGQLVRMSLFYAGAAVLYLLLRFAVQDNVPSTDEQMDIINNTLAAAPDLSHRYSTAVEIMGKYILLLIAPVTLSSDYSFAQIPVVGWTDWQAWSSLLTILLLIVTALLLFRKKDPLSFCILYFFITMAMVSNIFMMIGATLAERFLFTPSLAICVGAPVLLVRILRNDEKNISFNSAKAFLGVTAVILILFSVKTIARNTEWKNNFMLFTAGIKNAPNSASAHSSYASELRRQAEEGKMDPVARQKLLDEAIQEYRNALKIYPGFAEANYNMGVSFWDYDNIDSAAAAYRRTLVINPDYTNALNNLGVYHIRKGRYDSAILVYRSLIQKQPSFSQAYANIGAAYHNLGNLDSALFFYNKTLTLDPNNESVKNNMQKIYNSKSGILK